MGTHNLLLRLGESLFLEVISPNPQAAPPERPRWFGLDKLRQDALPALSAWVARTTDIRAMAAASSEMLGDIEHMSRGALDWLFTIPTDGSIVLDGAAPALIEWNADAHPASRLKDAGLSLVELKIFHHEPARIVRWLSSLGMEGPVSVFPIAGGVAPHLVAYVGTPQGLRQLAVASGKQWGDVQ